MDGNTLPTYLKPGYPQSLVMLRVRNEPDTVLDELWAVLTRADEAANEAWRRGGGPYARALLEVYFPGEYEAWERSREASKALVDDTPAF